MNAFKKIVLTDGDDERVQAAAKELIRNHVCHPVLIGDVTKINEAMSNYDNHTAISLDDSELSSLKAEAEKKGKVFPVADIALAQGAALVRDGKADGIVGGAVATTPDVFRVYAKVLGVRPDVSRVTSCFLMEKNEYRCIFADCALNPISDAQQLAETAFLSAEFASGEGIKPKVAFLSFQTVDNADHTSLTWIHTAVQVARETYGLTCDGPLQFDSAFDKKVAARKVSESEVAGKATVFIFPDLNSGNIGYKIAERMGGYKATGPLFLGFSKPAHDLSRGCSIVDIVNVVKITVKQAEQLA